MPPEMWTRGSATDRIAQIVVAKSEGTSRKQSQRTHLLFQLLKRRVRLQDKRQPLSATADSSSHAKSCTASASTSAVFRLPDMTRNSGRSTRVYQHVPKPSCTSYLSNWPSHTSSEPASPASVTGGRISIRTLVGSEYLGNPADGRIRIFGKLIEIAL